MKLQARVQQKYSSFSGTPDPSGDGWFINFIGSSAYIELLTSPRLEGDDPIQECSEFGVITVTISHCVYEEIYVENCF